MALQREIVGVFQGEKIAFENGDTRVVIGSVATESGDVVIKGEAAVGELKPGIEYRFYGHTVTHWKHGQQFAFASYVVQEPATAEGVVAYLRQCDGIGTSTAWAIWEAFGPDAVRKLREDPIGVATAVPRFSAAKARAASDFLSQFVSIERAKLDLIGLLNGRGFPKKTIDRAIQKWGSAAAHIIRRDPHYLMAFRGCGFLGTDKMYREIGRNPARIKRQALCAWHAISRDQDGHTWFPLSQAHQAIRASVARASPRPERATELALRSGMLSLKFDQGTEWIAEGRKARSEERLARWLDDARRELIEDRNEPVEYRPLENFLGYRVGSDGDVQSCWSNSGNLGESWRSLKPDTIKGGYRRVRLRVANQEYLHRQVSHLVLGAFWGPRPLDYVACHWDGNPENNAVNNLRWDSRSDNEQDKHRHGTHQTGEGNPAAKLTDSEVLQIRALYEEGNLSTYDLSDQFNISRCVIGKIVKHELWSHI